MNVYDTVNKLAQEIKESDEYKTYKKYKCCACKKSSRCPEFYK